MKFLCNFHQLYSITAFSFVFDLNVGFKLNARIFKWCRIRNPHKVGKEHE